MRLFTAIPLSSEAKTAVDVITRGRLPVPYINTTNLHITLNFFGELTDAEANKVRIIFELTVKGLEKFSVEFDKLVKFRDQIHLTIVPNDKLNSLQTVLQKAFEAGGFKFQEREYYAHVKLTNLHMDKVMNPERKLDNFPQEELKQLNFVAEKVILYEAKLLLHHARHIPLLELNLV
ncbi:MAG TPA: 2'-5' RNA ligase family protein [Patescibacteria group bacterium]